MSTHTSPPGWDRPDAEFVVGSPIMTGLDEADLIRRADAARTAFLRTGAVADAEEAVRWWPELVVLNGDNADYFDELGSAFQCLYEAGGVGEHLRRARAHYEKAVELDRDPALLNNLGDCLRVCHRELGDRDALEQARVVLAEAVEGIPEVDPDRLLCMDNLALVLSDLFSLRGDPDELRQGSGALSVVGVIRGGCGGAGEQDLLVHTFAA
jgi:hypothetical protein